MPRLCSGLSGLMTRPSAPSAAKLRARDVTIHYWIERSATPFCAVDGASLEIRPGEFVSIVGPSGCGKTTFLNAVDGLQPISGGALELNGQPCAKQKREHHNLEHVAPRHSVDYARWNRVLKRARERRRGLRTVPRRPRGRTT